MSFRIAVIAAVLAGLAVPAVAQQTSSTTMHHRTSRARHAMHPAAMSKGAAAKSQAEQAPANDQPR